MNQCKVLEWFHKRALTGSNEYLTHIDIYRSLRREGYKGSYNSLNRMILSMRKSGLIECNVDARHIIRVKYRYPTDKTPPAPTIVEHPEQYTTKGRVVSNG